jgi:hypothetical protein
MLVNNERKTQLGKTNGGSNAPANPPPGTSNRRPGGPIFPSNTLRPFSFCFMNRLHHSGHA